MHTLKAFAIGMAGSASGGGLERYYFDLMRALPGAGVAVRGLVTADAAGSCDGTPDVAAFAGARDSMLRRWSRMRALAPALAADADVTVSHFAPYAFPVLDALAKKPFVVHFHGPWALESRAEGAGSPQALVRAAIERLVYARGTRFITLSGAFARILARRYRVPEERVAIVRGGVDLARFNVRTPRAEARERLGWPNDRRIIMAVRRLVPSKGIEGLIDATVSLRRIDPAVLVNIFGTGPLAAALQRRIDDAGLAANVRLAGHASDETLVLAYRAADVSVVPSIAFEGFGLVAIESLACGTPVMVTHVGGLPEAVRDLDPQLVFDGSDADAIARGLGRVLGGEQRLPTEAQSLRYAERFDWAHVARDVAAVYAKTRS